MVTKYISSKARSDWSFKDKELPETKIVFSKKNTSVKVKKKSRKEKRQLIGSGDEFYKSQEWLRLRYRVIKKYGGECMACGRSRKRHQVVIHVDHILPRSKFPRQALSFENLQILCEDCNIGKSNIDSTDWRPENQQKDDDEMAIVINAQQYI